MNKKQIILSILNDSKRWVNGEYFKQFDGRTLAGMKRSGLIEKADSAVNEAGFSIRITGKGIETIETLGVLDVDMTIAGIRVNGQWMD